VITESIIGLIEVFIPDLAKESFVLMLFPVLVKESGFGCYLALSVG
jgi:hypothetical protein